MQRRRSAPHKVEQNIAAEKARLEGQVAKLKPGPERDGLLKKIRQLETASHINEWLSSPGSSHQNPPRSEAASCVDGPRFARVFSRDEQWSLAVMCPAFQCGLT